MPGRKLEGAEVTIMFSIALLAAINSVVGAGVDDDSRSLYKWFESCPVEISLVAQPLVMMLWPVVLVVWLWSRSKQRK
jgi:hypothetical protein